MHCWARYLFIATVVSLGIASMVGACGQKGPLYLPKEPPAADAQPQPDAGAADDPAASVPAPTSGPARP